MKVSRLKNLAVSLHENGERVVFWINLLGLPNLLLRNWSTTSRGLISDSKRESQIVIAIIFVLHRSWRHVNSVRLKKDCQITGNFIFVLMTNRSSLIARINCGLDEMAEMLIVRKSQSIHSGEVASNSPEPSVTRRECDIHTWLHGLFLSFSCSEIAKLIQLHTFHWFAETSFFRLSFYYCSF